MEARDELWNACMRRERVELEQHHDAMIHREMILLDRSLRPGGDLIDGLRQADLHGRPQLVTAIQRARQTAREVVRESQPFAAAGEDRVSQDFVVALAELGTARTLMGEHPRSERTRWPVSELYQRLGDWYEELQRALQKLREQEKAKQESQAGFDKATQAKDGVIKSYKEQLRTSEEHCKNKLKEKEEVHDTLIGAKDKMIESYKTELRTSEDHCRKKLKERDEAYDALKTNLRKSEDGSQELLRQTEALCRERVTVKDRELDEMSKKLRAAEDESRKRNNAKDLEMDEFRKRTRKLEDEKDEEVKKAKQDLNDAKSELENQLRAKNEELKRSQQALEDAKADFLKQDQAKDEKLFQAGEALAIAKSECVREMQAKDEELKASDQALSDANVDFAKRVQAKDDKRIEANQALVDARDQCDRRVQAKDTELENARQAAIVAKAGFDKQLQIKDAQLVKSQQDLADAQKQVQDRRHKLDSSVKELHIPVGGLEAIIDIQWLDWDIAIATQTQPVINDAEEILARLMIALAPKNYASVDIDLAMSWAELLFHLNCGRPGWCQSSPAVDLLRSALNSAFAEADRISQMVPLPEAYDRLPAVLLPLRLVQMLCFALVSEDDLAWLQRVLLEILPLCNMFQDDLARNVYEVLRRCLHGEVLSNQAQICFASHPQTLYTTGTESPAHLWCSTEYTILTRSRPSFFWVLPTTQVSVVVDGLLLDVTLDAFRRDDSMQPISRPLLGMWIEGDGYDLMEMVEKTPGSIRIETRGL